MGPQDLLRVIQFTLIHQGGGEAIRGFNACAVVDSQVVLKQLKGLSQMMRCLFVQAQV